MPMPGRAERAAGHRQLAGNLNLAQRQNLAGSVYVP